MLCPICRQPMLIVELEHVELDMCPECHGIWFDAQELQQLFELAGARDKVIDLDYELDHLPHGPTRRTCPRCRGRLRPAKAPTGSGRLILDECPQGHGLWFDEGELQTLLESVLNGEQDSLHKVRQFLARFTGATDAAEGRDAAESETL